jgi:hypothetical protein
LAAKLRDSGAPAKLVSIQNGDHGSYSTVIDWIFDFFAAHSRAEPGSAESVQ